MKEYQIRINYQGGSEKWWNRVYRDLENGRVPERMIPLLENGETLTVSKKELREVINWALNIPGWHDEPKSYPLIFDPVYVLEEVKKGQEIVDLTQRRKKQMAQQDTYSEFLGDVLTLPAYHLENFLDMSIDSNAERDKVCEIALVLLNDFTKHIGNIVDLLENKLGGKIRIVKDKSGVPVDIIIKHRKAA